MVEEQSRICAFFQTIQCENNMHENCEEIFGNAELNLEARCTCGCHITENKIKVVPDSRIRARERVASVSQKQMTLDEIGVANTDEHADDR
ncbi:MAG: hypothetical protein ACHQ1D_04280 [Nitrososphaerales archaeon]